MLTDITIKAMIDSYDRGVLEHLFDSVAHPGMNIAEIGCAMGGTTAYLAFKLEPYKGIIFAIDSWEDVKLFQQFWQNVRLLIGNHLILPIRIKSVDASFLFENKTFDLIFIDADHAYSQVKEDIECWLPKVKPGGILCGHDCEKKYTDYCLADQEEIVVHQEDDKTSFTCHAGVIKALYDMFADNYSLERRIWHKVIQ